MRKYINYHHHKNDDDFYIIQFRKTAERQMKFLIFATALRWGVHFLLNIWKKITLKHFVTFLSKLWHQFRLESWPPERFTFVFGYQSQSYLVTLICLLFNVFIFSSFFARNRISYFDSYLPSDNWSYWNFLIASSSKIIYTTL